MEPEWKKDLRNARYAERHKGDNISEHGKYMREFFRTHTREERAYARAFKQAISDIREDLMQRMNIDVAQANRMMKDLFEPE